jgi:hypothetical protein
MVQAFLLDPRAICAGRGVNYGSEKALPRAPIAN